MDQEFPYNKSSETDTHPVLYKHDDSANSNGEPGADTTAPGVDATTGATSWARAAAALEPQAAMCPSCAPLPAVSDDPPQPPVCFRPGKKSNVDATTGATPGVASACRELDMTSPTEVSMRLGIKLPGEA